MLAVAALEMWNSALDGLRARPDADHGRGRGARQACLATRSRRTYLAKLVSGEWMGTMNLTEPQAGSDLGALTRPRRARAPTAPTASSARRSSSPMASTTSPTTSSIWCWRACPTRRPARAASRCSSCRNSWSTTTARSARRNDLFCHSLEHKLGIHGSPTCTMIYGDGFVRRREGRDRLADRRGEQGPRLHVHDDEQCPPRRRHAGRRRSPRPRPRRRSPMPASAARARRRAGPGEGMSPIIEHPDVAAHAAHHEGADRRARAPSPIPAPMRSTWRASREGETRSHWQERANLLTPIAKAFSTDVGVEVASLGIQVHGGMGFIEETGAAALYRDARIAPIYEGTNGIQAIDLVTRKLPLSGGEHVRGYIAELAATVAEVVRTPNRDGFGRTAERAASARIDDLDGRHALSAADAGRRRGRRGAGRRDALSAAVRAGAGGAYLARGRTGRRGSRRASRSAASSPRTWLARPAPLRDRVMRRRRKPCRRRQDPHHRLKEHP